MANQLEVVASQFRIGLYPFIRYLDSTYSPLTGSINGNSQTPGTINYAAANLATLLDTNMNANLGSGGTHIDTALGSINSLITSVGDGSSTHLALCLSRHRRCTGQPGQERSQWRLVG